MEAQLHLDNKVEHGFSSFSLTLRYFYLLNRLQIGCYHAMFSFITSGLRAFY